MQERAIEVPGPVRDLVGYAGKPPKVTWPGGACIAISLVVNYEEGSESAVGDGTMNPNVPFQKPCLRPGSLENATSLLSRCTSTVPAPGFGASWIFLMRKMSRAPFLRAQWRLNEIETQRNRSGRVATM